MQLLLDVKDRVNDNFCGQSNQIIALVPAVNLRHDKPTYQEYESINDPSYTIDTAGTEGTTFAIYVIYYSLWSCSSGRW